MEKCYSLKHLLLVVPIMLFLHSCKKDNTPEVAKEKSSIASLVNIAKLSLEKQSISGRPLLTGLKSIGMVPDWFNMKTSINSKNKTVLAIPLEQSTTSFSELNVIINNGVPHEVIKKYTVSNDHSILLEFYALNGTLLKTGQYDITSGKFQLSKSVIEKVSLYELRTASRSNGNLFLLLANNKNKLATKIKTTTVNGIHDLEEVEIEGEGPAKPGIEDPQGPPTSDGSGPIDYFPVEPVPPSGGSSGSDGSPQNDPSKADHTLNLYNLPPNNSEKQVSNTCVFATMVWINKFLGGKININEYIKKYAEATGPAETVGERSFILITNGIEQNELSTLVSMFFKTTTTESIQTSINSNFPLMGTISTGTAGEGHEVMITGYNDNGSIQYFDPQTGKYEIKTTPGEFSNIITVTQNK